MCRVSVIIPVYNVEKWLPACLDSVLSQTLQDIEVLAIDDKSPDRCPEILDEYAGRDSRIRVFHLPENRRQGYGRNLGLENARGRYVYFLDSDDMITKEALEELADIADRDQLDGIHFDSQAVYDDEELKAEYSGKYIAGRQGKYEDKIYEGEELFQAFSDHLDWQVYVQRQIWRRSYLLEKGIRFPVGAEHEDQFFSIASLAAAGRVRYIPKPYFIRRWRRDSVMTVPFRAKNFHGYFVNVHELIAFLRKEGRLRGAALHEIRMLMSYMVSMYWIFEQEEDPLSWFRPQGLEDEYEFFSLFLMDLLEFEHKKFRPLRRYDSVMIYGAGKIARSISVRFRMIGIDIPCFIVSSKEGNPEEIDGKPVVLLDEIGGIEKGEESCVMVAMAKEHHEGLSKELSRRGILHYLYASNKLEGPFR